MCPELAVGSGWVEGFDVINLADHVRDCFEGRDDLLDAEVLLTVRLTS